MTRRTTFILAVAGLLLFAGVRFVSGSANAAANAPADQPYAGKVLLVYSMAGQGQSSPVTLEKIELRQLANRSFLVGNEVTNPAYEYTVPHFGGALIWVPTDAITQIVEVSPSKRVK